MVGNHQLIDALSSPTQDQWTETLSLELARSQLFCLLSVVGEQAGNIGKELLGLWQRQSVLSSEAVYQVLTEYAQIAVDTRTRISCAVIVFRGTRTTVATLRAGVSLRRDNLAKPVIKVSDGVEIREGSSQLQDLYFLYTELAGRQAEKLLFQSKYPDQLLKQWRVAQVEILESTVGAESLGVGLVLPKQLLDSKVGQGFLEVDQGMDPDGTTSFGMLGGSKSGEKNLLKQRRASRKTRGGWRQSLSISLGLITVKMLRKPVKKQAGDSDKVSEDKLLDILTAKSALSRLPINEHGTVNHLGSTDSFVDKSTVKTSQADSILEQFTTDRSSVVNKKIDLVGEFENKNLTEENQPSQSRAVDEATEMQNQVESKSSESNVDRNRLVGEDLVTGSKTNEFGQKAEKKQSRGADLVSSVKNFGCRLKSRKSVFVGHHVSQKRLLMIIGSILLIIALLVGIGYLRLTRQVEDQVELGQLLPYQQKLEEIRVLGETDPVLARAQAQSQLAELGGKQAKGNLPRTAKTELERLLNETKALYESLDVVSDLTALPLFDDLRRLSPAFLASTATGHGSQGILADRDQQLLIAYTTTDKTGQVVDAASLEKVIAVSQIGEQSYVLGDGVWRLSSLTATELNQVIQPGTQTDGATLIASFGSNVYVFNPTQRALFRYSASGSTFGSPTNWLTGAAPFTFADVSSVVVDGEVWFGSNQGQIYKFVGGRQAEFTISGLEKPLSSTVYLATDSESELMAVLEPAGKRLLILNKETGLVSREFVNPNLGATTGLWLDGANNQVLVSSGAALYNILINE